MKWLQKRFALSEKGARDVVKGSIFCALQNIAFMFPVGLLYLLVSDLLHGELSGRLGIYVVGVSLA